MSTIISCDDNFLKIYELCSTNERFFNEFKKFKNVTLFDVSLRDGLQGLNNLEQELFTIERKKELYSHIISLYSPKNIEIGSYVNKKVLPIFNDTEDFFTFVEQNNEYSKKLINNYVLIPNEKQLLTSIKNGCNNFSFITSVSNNFQLKNTKMTLEQSDNSIYNMLYSLNNNDILKKNPSVKLYVSCINECPIEGKINNDFIVDRLVNLNKMNVNTICLSDTCGTLTNEDFKYILEKCCYYGLPAEKISLHLHVKNEKEDEVEKIIYTALDHKITSFDVSLLESGGCSVTIDKKNLTSNLSYNLFYKILLKYIIKNIDEQ